jgi:hypothetical protein
LARNGSAMTVFDQSSGAEWTQKCKAQGPSLPCSPVSLHSTA